MSLRKTDEFGLPLKSNVWCRIVESDCIIVRNDGANHTDATRIHSYCINDSIIGNKGLRSYKKFGTTPGGRSYTIVTRHHPDGTFYRKMEVFGLGESHVKVRCNNGEKAKVLRKFGDSFLNGVLALGPQISKSFTIPQIH